MRKLWLLLLIISPTSVCYSQTITGGDSLIKNNTEPVKVHSAKKATIYAAVLPGLGHVYNEKYWKLPIVYVGIGTSIFFISQNNKYYQDFLTSYKYRVDNDPNTNDLLYSDLTDAEVFSNLELTRTWLEWSYVATIGIYLLQIVDASVDAHLFNFDVSDDLSLNIRPSLIQTQNRMDGGLALTFSF